MDQPVEIHGKPLKLSIRQAAEKQLQQRTEPLLLEMERYFPHWLTLDFRHGKWQAEFGYGREAA
jgi:hypothetical protein